MTMLSTVAELTADRSDLPPTVDLQGWNSTHPVFAKLIAETDPHVIIEVGTWKGASALHMAQLTASRRERDQASGVDVPAPAHIYCVDTWLGGVDHVLSQKPQDDRFLDRHGSPRLYEQFLRNVVEMPAEAAQLASYAGRIHPVRQTSLNGARILAHFKVQADLIYIDGSHEYDDVYADLCAYMPLLSEKGVMFGDDFRTFPGVFAAVVRYAHEHGCRLNEEAGNFWILR